MRKFLLGVLVGVAVMAMPGWTLFAMIVVGVVLLAVIAMGIAAGA
jgi:hypothetical protein